MIGSPEDAAATLNAIIDHAERANAMLGITGILLHTKHTGQVHTSM